MTHDGAARTGTAFDFFAAGALPAPLVSEAEAATIAAAHFDLDVRARSLGSHQDANFLLTAGDDDGAVAGVLKISNAAFGPGEIAAQEAAAEHLARRAPDLRVATAAPGPPTRVTLASGGAVVARVLRYLPGGSLSGSRYLSPESVAALGRVAGSVSAALADFDHPALHHRVLQWDLRHAPRAVSGLAPSLAAPALRSRVLAATDAEWRRLDRVAHLLPRQAIHGDVTDDNVVCTEVDGRRLPDGVIDLGDLVVSWAVGELAVTLSSVLHHDGIHPADVLPAVAAFAAVRPLSEAEIDALWPLVVLRGAVLVVSGHHQLAVDGSNSYVAGNMAREQRVFEAATSVPSAVMAELLRSALGVRGWAHPLPPAGRLVGGAAGDRRIERLDLSSTADALDGGAWAQPDIEESLARAALDGGAGTVLTAFGEGRLTRARPLSPVPPENRPTGIDAWWDGDVTLVAPWDGEAADDGRRLRADGIELSIGAPTGATRPGRPVRRGDVLVNVPARTRTRLTLRRLGPDGDDPDVPPFVPGQLWNGWRGVVTDPSGLLGVPRADQAVAASTDRGADLLERRAAAFAPLQEHYYAEPPRIERGWREHLVDTEGRPYLDMVNNVAVLGHGHLGVSRVVARQLRRLNTNSRFHYAAVVEFSERLVELLPPPLDTVFLVNSGSEANDLALRIALATTGHRDLVAVGEAYHGWTYLTDAVSTSTADNPGAVGTRPSWVHTVDAPNPYRGRHRGEAAARYAVDAVARIDSLAAGGSPPAAFIAEAVYGTAGGMVLPTGYLPAVYEAVRRHGGLTVADEVQVGYGRLGEWFWGFEQQGVVPDVVTVAKAMGNGHPLGAVVTSREVAEAYRSQGYFFSSAGGSPVSCVVGLAVLDAIRDEGLQQNAHVVGEHLRGRLEALGARRPIIGAVHGRGLYLGVELVRDRDTLEPATRETAAICERMLRLGIVVQPTGEWQSVLKVKPPMCLTRESADHFVDTLDRVLTTGW